MTKSQLIRAALSSTEISTKASNLGFGLRDGRGKRVRYLTAVEMTTQ